MCCRRGESFQSFLSGIQGFAGTPIGSLFALALYLNLSYADLMEIAQPRMSHMQSLIPQFDISLFFLKYGVDEGSEMQAFIKTVMRVGGVNADATLADLHRLLKRAFVRVATNAHTCRPTNLLFGVDDSKGARAATRSTCRCACPLLLQPIRHESELRVDGSLSDNTPDCFPKAQTLYLCCAGPRSRHWSIDTPMDYFCVHLLDVDRPPRLRGAASGAAEHADQHAQRELDGPLRIRRSRRVRDTCAGTTRRWRTCTPISCKPWLD